MDKHTIEQIVAATVEELMRSQAAVPSCGRGADTPAQGWLFATIDEAVAAAVHSQRILREEGLEKRKTYIEAMRNAARANARTLAQMAHEDTGYGHVDHKEQKNLLAANQTPGVEDLEPRAFTGDEGLTLVEMAPFGVIGSIIPSTNPTSTAINNAISMVAAGNAVVFNPHPAALRCSHEAMRVMQEAITAAGGPPSLITTVQVPTLETSKQIMSHPDIAILSVTGGEAVVSVAMASGKRVIAAGPGNPPVVVDDTAILPDAARIVADGASFDNNVLCVAEKEVFAFASIADRFIELLQKEGAWLIRGADIDKVRDTVLQQADGKWGFRREFVGRDATHILSESGIAYTGSPRLVIAEVDAEHPFVTTEMLMPVLAIVRVNDIDEAVRRSVKAENGCHHSAMIHSTNVKNMSHMAREMNTTIFVKNAPSYAGLGFGGEGYATLTIATPTGEGLTSARTFTRQRRCVLYGDFRIL